MWMEKLARGVLELETPIGSRYLQPSLFQRVVLLWTFRNFPSLPQQVLRPHERRMIDRLCNQNCFISLSAAGSGDRPVIGRVERRYLAPVEVMAVRKPVASSSQSAIAGDRREAASA